MSDPQQEQRAIWADQMGPMAWLVYRDGNKVAIGLCVHRDGCWQAKVSGDIVARSHDLSACIEAINLHDAKAKGA